MDTHIESSLKEQRDLASGQGTVGDTTTLEDFSVLAKLREEEE